MVTEKVKDTLAVNINMYNIDCCIRVDYHIEVSTDYIVLQLLVKLHYTTIIV